jgi:ParB/RepB/Spo0J family partition protein
MAAVAEAITTGITDIPLSRLFPAPWNARKTFDETALADLTASIQAKGINVPLIVRPIKHKGKDSGDFEIVAGERRSRAAQLAARSDAPCIVRDLSDDEARELGMVDNLQREDLAPLDEAKTIGCSARAVIGSVAAVRVDCARLQYDTGDPGMITFVGDSSAG